MYASQVNPMLYGPFGPGVSMNELWDLYTEQRKLSGLTHIRGNKISTGFYHIVVEVWTVFNDGTVLITQRHPSKPFPLLYECTGGSILKGEDSLHGAIRELLEETGIRTTSEKLQKIYEYSNKDTIYDVYVNKEKSINIEDLNIPNDEVINAKIVSIQEIEKLISSGLMIPKLKYFLELYKKNIK